MREQKRQNLRSDVFFDAVTRFAAITAGSCDCITRGVGHMDRRWHLLGDGAVGTDTVLVAGFGFFDAAAVALKDSLVALGALVHLLKQKDKTHTKNKDRPLGRPIQRAGPRGLPSLERSTPCDRTIWRCGRCGWPAPSGVAGRFRGCLLVAQRQAMAGLASPRAGSESPRIPSFRYVSSFRPGRIGPWR